MRIFAASDLHFEFHRDIEWLPPLPEADTFDILILAGDIGAGAYLGSALRRLRYKYPDKPIIFTAGNHEHYSKNINRDIMARIDVPDVYYLENCRVDLLGFHFLGSTLWTNFDCMGEELRAEAMKLASKHVADFIDIRTAELSESNGVRQLITPNQMAALYHQARAWLIGELQTVDPKKTIVVTHFPPSREYRHKDIDEDLISAYFQSNCADIIEKFQPALWVYGHNHYSSSHISGKTRIISNQLGYPNESCGYRGDLIINIPNIPSLQEMLAAYDPAAPISQDITEWMNSPPVGDELL